jgi:alpha-ribazole phosphatase
LARLLLVRHGITEYNTDIRFQGHTDTELSGEGYRQAEKLAERLAEEPIDAVYSSDLKRAIATAEAVASRKGIEIVQSPELREMNYGEIEGMTFSELNEKYPEVGKNIMDFNTDLSLPGGETFLGFAERIRGFEDVLSEYNEDQTVLIVSHGGVLKTLVCNLLGIDYSHWPQIGFSNASLSIVFTYRRRTVLNLLNDVSHLNNMNI